MKKRNRVFAAILAASMVTVSLAGCGSDNNKGSESTQQAAEQGGDTTSASADSKWMVGDPDNPIELTVFLNHTWYPTEEFTGIIPDEITKRTGVRLVPTKATDATQLGVLASSGELPDLVFTSQMMDILSDPDICYSYNELIDEYNVDWDIDQSHIVNA